MMFRTRRAATKQAKTLTKAATLIKMTIAIATKTIKTTTATKTKTAATPTNIQTAALLKTRRMKATPPRVCLKGCGK